MNVRQLIDTLLTLPPEATIVGRDQLGSVVYPLPAIVSLELTADAWHLQETYGAVKRGPVVAIKVL